MQQKKLKFQMHKEIATESAAAAEQDENESKEIKFVQTRRKLLQYFNWSDKLQGRI